LKILLDQGLPRSTARLLREAGLDALHTAEIGMAAAADDQILARAVIEGRIIVTLDADFHTLLALTAANKPSVIRFRVEGLQANDLKVSIEGLLKKFEKNLREGAVISVRENSIRLRNLPIG
jgi:predicted nuclease of predicted toxin-antitoxin system